MNKESFAYINKAVSLIRVNKNKEALGIINKAIGLLSQEPVLLIFKSSLVSKMGKPFLANKIIKNISKNDLGLEILKLFEITEIEILMEQNNYREANRKIKLLIKKD